MCRKRAIVAAMMLVLITILSNMAVAENIYVDPNAIGDNDGTSWPIELCMIWTKLGTDCFLLQHLSIGIVSTFPT